MPPASTQVLIVWMAPQTALLGFLGEDIVPLQRTFRWQQHSRVLTGTEAAVEAILWNCGLCTLVVCPVTAFGTSHDRHSRSPDCTSRVVG